MMAPFLPPIERASLDAVLDVLAANTHHMGISALQFVGALLNEEIQRRSLQVTSQKLRELERKYP